MNKPDTDARVSYPAFFVSNRNCTHYILEQLSA